MVYEIQPYSFKKAKDLGVTIKPSTKKGKKIDVFKNNQLLTSIGASGMNDYPTYLKNEGKKIAEERKRLYKIRHSKNIGIAGKYASEILW
jgi:hypothetical protein